MVIELDDPVILSLQVYPICLPDDEYTNPDSMKNQFATLVGYGPETDKSTEVNLINQKIIPIRRCNFKYNPAKTNEFLLRQKIEITLPHMFQHGLICAGKPGNSQEGTCGGDSGAPLLTEETVDYDTGEIKFMIVAVLHGGIIPCDNSKYPAVYNRIDTPGTLKWILNVLAGKYYKR